MTATENQDLYQAVITAFSLVSYADGQVHMSELSRMLKILKEEGLFKNVTAEQLQDNISDIVRGINRDLDKINLPALLSVIGKIKNDVRSREIVLKIARLTLIADGKITEGEERMLAEIHRTLGASEELR